MKQVILGLSALSVAFGVLPAQAQNIPDFQVVLLGTGTPPPLMHRFGPATFVQVAGKSFLFDAGRGATQRMWQKKSGLGKDWNISF